LTTASVRRQPEHLCVVAVNHHMLTSRLPVLLPMVLVEYGRIGRRQADGWAGRALPS
jgi:hypothetical protein